MAVHKIREKYFVYKGEKHAETKFREELSRKIIENFGKGPFIDQSVIRKIINYCLEYYISKFKEICHNETSLEFYKNIFWFHEQATELAHYYPHQNHSPEISESYFALYRRILKFILEMGCEVPMLKGEKCNKELKERVESKLDDLLFLGQMIFNCVSLYAEQTMIEDVAEFYFNEKDLYVFVRKHHYNFIFHHFEETSGIFLTESITDSNGIEDLDSALEKCFGIRYGFIIELIDIIHKELEAMGSSEFEGVGWKTFSNNLKEIFGVPSEIGEQFFKGLRLDKSNKMDLLDLACKPYKLNRYLYRPMIIWSVEGDEYAFVGKSSFKSAIFQLVSNAIPWGKAPEEWMQNQCFKEYVHRKEDQHDKWLDDEVEKILIKHELHYDRNIESLQSSKGLVNINVPGLGEIDFIIVANSLKKIFIVDCKHLLGRYDIVNQRNDYNAFVKNNKSYNETMRQKVLWFTENSDLLDQHFQHKYEKPTLSFNDYEIEGIFIVNTPTFYMYNAEFRIYTINQIEDVLTGNYDDPVFPVWIVEDGKKTILNIEYPYFQKPTYLEIDPFIDEDLND